MDNVIKGVFITILIYSLVICLFKHTYLLKKWYVPWIILALNTCFIEWHDVNPNPNKNNGKLMLWLCYRSPIWWDKCLWMMFTNCETFKLITW
jgi:hypothetical protein